MMTTVRQLNILLVEDDEVDVMNVQRALKKNGATSPLYRAANGIEALTLLRTNEDLTTDPHSRLLILLDLNMPKMGGLEFLKELRSDTALRHIPVVVLTTSRQDKDLATAYEYNVAGYIVKPVTFGNFVETIDVLNRYWVTFRNALNPLISMEAPTLTTVTLTDKVFTVLVIDDDAVDRMSVRRAFKGADFQSKLLEASDCATAIELVDRHQFDCIFVDYRLPDGNGVELLQKLRTLGIRIPIVSLTGQSDDRVAVELMKAGASDYISKSEVSPAKLRQVFQNVMRVYDAECAAADAQRQREELLAQKEEFISRMTHDLQTPLVAANRMLDLIADDAFGEVPVKVKTSLKTIVRSNEDLLQMVRNIVEAYTYDANAKQFNFIPLDLRKIVEEVVTELSPIATTKNIVISATTVDRNRADANFLIPGDRLELKRLITNLVGNSLKFTEVGEISIELIPSTPDRPWINISIRDTGTGIPSSDLAHLFERFRRGNHKRSNSGLGLYLCKQIAEAHGGQISVRSTPGEGSIFTIELPIDRKI